MERRLEWLEEAIDLVGKNDVAEIFEEEMFVEEKLHDTLEKYFDFKMEMGGSDFKVSIFKNGYVPPFYELPPRYREKIRRRGRSSMT